MSMQSFKVSEGGTFLKEQDNWNHTVPGLGLSHGCGSAALLNAAAENKAKHAVSNCQRAEKARTTQTRRIGRLNTQRFIKLADGGRILNCDVTGQNIMNAEDTFGPERGSLKGKTVRKACIYFSMMSLLRIAWDLVEPTAKNALSQFRLLRRRCREPGLKMHSYSK
jgi:hypothetical protein